MASSKNVRMGRVRHRKICGLLKKWCGVAEGSVTAEDCQEVCECICLGLCLCMYALFHTYNHTHTRSHVHTHIHSHPLAADCMLTSLLGGAGDAGVLAAIDVRQAYPCVHPLYSVEQDESVQ
jgi:hypothetical protein